MAARDIQKRKKKVQLDAASVSFVVSFLLLFFFLSLAFPFFSNPPLPGFYRVSLVVSIGPIGFCRVLLGFTGFYWVLLGFTGF